MTADASPSEILEGPFDGQYGQWYLTKADADGVAVYRSALAVMSAAFALLAGLALVPGIEAPSAAYDFLYVLSTGAFAVALQTIHIYLRPLHQALKALWLLGAAGALVLLVSPLTDHSIVLTTYSHPAAMLAIGWQFIALTGLFIKEAFCFGQLEALALIALTPILTGGHFLGVLPSNVESIGSIMYAASFIYFSVRKFMQPAREDLGDLSVFEHLAKGGEL